MTTESWERETEQAWADLEVRLSDWLRDDPEGDTVIIELPSPHEDLAGASPSVQLTVGEDGFVRAEAASNYHLDHRFALGAAQAAQLEQLGWLPPTVVAGETPDAGSTNFFVDLGLPGDADRLAGLLVAAVRDVFGVPDPSFLVVSGFGENGRLETAELPFGLTVVEPDEAEVEVDVDLTVAATDDADELRDLVEATLADLLDVEISYDEDGDMPLPTGSTVVFVRVEEDCPSIRLFAPLVLGVRWTPRVGSALNDLNQRIDYAKVIYQGGAVIAAVQLWAMPFAPALLRQAVVGMRELVDGLDHQLQEQVGGRLFADDTPPGTSGSTGSAEGRS